MTATQTAPFGFPHNLLAFLRRAGSFALKAMLAIAIIFAAGIIAVATAAAGLALAAVALMMRLFGGTQDNPRQDKTHMHEHMDGEGITLDARKTPRGWTVE